MWRDISASHIHAHTEPHILMSFLQFAQRKFSRTKKIPKPTREMPKVMRENER